MKIILIIALLMIIIGAIIVYLYGTELFDELSETKKALRGHFIWPPKPAWLELFVFSMMTLFGFAIFLAGYIWLCALL